MGIRKDLCFNSRHLDEKDQVRMEVSLLTASLGDGNELDGLIKQNES
jgi:hypothetical protein